MDNQERVDELEDELDEIESQFDEAESEWNDFENQITESEIEQASLEEEIAALDYHIDGIKSDQLYAADEMQSLGDEIDQLKIQIAKAEEVVDDEKLDNQNRN